MRRLLVPLLLATAACSPASSAPDSGTVTCLNAAGVDPFVRGMEKTSVSGRVKVTLVSADPEPPARGENDWVLKVSDSSGAAVAPDFDLFMPEHGHNSTRLPDVTAQPDGSFKAERLSLFMPGLWRITVSPSASAPADDAVVFMFCVEG